MINQIFVNLPVKDLQKTIQFFTALGFTFNPTFTDDTSTCMIIGPNIFAMLMAETRFKDFIKKQVADSKATTEVINALQMGSKEDVVAMANKVVAAGGKLHRDADDHGWMYSQSIDDIDGHIWEFFFMDESKFPQNS